jgi:hypothetical protein
MLGWNRAHKHDENPDPQHIRDSIELSVISEICEWFDFEDSYKDENT